MKQELIPAASEPGPLTPAAMNPLLALAIEKGLSVEGLEKLVALHERVMDRQSAQEFAAAMASFQSECPPIQKTSTAKVTTKSGSQYSYQYAELDEIARTVRPLLHKHGLAYSWDSTLSENAAMLRVVCTLAHANGHKVSATFEAPTEALTQAMSPQQRHAAALTFARRQSLIQVLGLSMTDPDTDAAPEDVAWVTPAQVDEIEALIAQRPDGSRARLLDYLGVSTLEEIPANRFDWLVRDLTKKVKEQK